MKNLRFIPVLLLTFIAEIVICIVLVTQISDIKTDPVKVNDCMYSVKNNFGNPEKYNRELDYVIIDGDGNVCFKTKEDLSESVNEAIKTRGLILDLEIEGTDGYKIIFDYNLNGQLEDVKSRIIWTFIIIGGIQLVIAVCWYFILKKKILTPFRKINSFAARVAEGNLDIPLTMDKEHVFGEFTEAFDLMRSELKKARAAEKKANDDKNEMVAKLSHDIKTPVASIKSTSEIGFEVTQEERTKRMFNVINVKTDQIKALVDNLFNSSVRDVTEIAVNPGNYDSKDIKKLIKNADYLNKAGDFSVLDCSVFIDKLRLQQIFDNIFTNSYKYADTEISVHTGFVDEYLVISIADKGPGVKDEELLMLKQKYKRGSNATDKDGAGLGLYLVDYFCRKMDGEFKLKNLDQGFEASVYLRTV